MHRAAQEAAAAEQKGRVRGVRLETLPDVLIKSAEYRLRVGAWLMVVRLVDAANDSTCIGSKRN